MQMATDDTIRELLDREPFRPFRILTSAGESFTIGDPHSVAMMKSQVFIAHPGSDRSTYVPLLHIAAVDTLVNGHPGRPARRKRR
jgi:hypothetical protein